MTPKDINVFLYIAHQIGQIDYYTAFKILYFAEQKHLVRYGDRIINDDFHALPYGPVPTVTYDDMKAVRDNTRRGLMLLDTFNVKQDTVTALKQPDLDMLSESELECLNESIKENVYLSFEELYNKSHGVAWHTYEKKKMPTLEIAKEGGASNEMLEYIQTVLDYSQPILR